MPVLVFSTMPGTAPAYMVATFFMPRISLAAAIAAGVDCLTAGAAGCCASAGAADSASPTATVAADKSPEKRFIPSLLACGVIAVQQPEFLARRPERRRSPAR